MTWPFFNSSRQRKPKQVVALDLGSRVTKAVHVQQQGEKFVLLRYALLDAPIYEKSPPPVELLAEHLKSVAQALDTRIKNIAVAVGATDVLVRHVDMPEMPLDAMRMVLKNNARKYLQQDLPDHLFDCHVIYQAVRSAPPAGANGAAPGHLQRLLAAGAKKRFVDDLSAAAKAATLSLTHVTPGVVCPANAFELALPEVFASETVALIEVGFKCSTICILQQGHLVMNRVVSLGGDRLTSAIADELKISYAEAEGIKIGMAEEVRPALEQVISQLGRELRASLDYFEHQMDRSVSRIYVSGGSTQSEIILSILAMELMTECMLWNPVQSMHLELPPAQTAELPQVASQLGVAVGAAVGAL